MLSWITLFRLNIPRAPLLLTHCFSERREATFFHRDYHCSIFSYLDIQWRSQHSYVVYTVIAHLHTQHLSIFHKRTLHHYHGSKQFLLRTFSLHFTLWFIKKRGNKNAFLYTASAVSQLKQHDRHGETRRRRSTELPERGDVHPYLKPALAVCWRISPTLSSGSLRLPLLSKGPRSIHFPASSHLSIDPRSQWRHPFSCPTFTYLPEQLEPQQPNQDRSPLKIGKTFILLIFFRKISSEEDQINYPLNAFTKISISFIVIGEMIYYNSG